MSSAPAPTPSLASLPPARRAILLQLKQHGERSAEQLAAALSITASAARQHLGPLQQKGLVGVRQVKGAPGRPKFRYGLTAEGESLFPRRYGDLANELLDYASAERPALVEEMFERRRRRRVERARQRLEGKSFPEKVSELAALLDQDGYLADFSQEPDGSFRIVEHNCAILDVARRWGHACTSEIAFLREALPEAEIERVAHMIAGAHDCAYEVRRR